MSNTSSLISELESLLPSHGVHTGCKAWIALAKLKHSLPSVDSPHYTATRALALRDLALKLRDSLSSSSDSKFTYTDKATVLSSVADNYLKLTHAFKVDADVWTRAQTELVPLFSSVSDEKSLDFAISEMESHLNTYIQALSVWVSR